MKTRLAAPKTISAYIASFPPERQALLNALADAIRQIAPEAEERIAYQMPAFYFNGPLVYFAMHKKHIGFYPTPEGMEAFAQELSEYQTSKGAIQFPVNKPLPLELIKKIVALRLSQNQTKPKKH
ncbi:MAG: DUF1801 domain-containing protein [Anaerolineaceae bacterium]